MPSPHIVRILKINYITHNVKSFTIDKPNVSTSAEDVASDVAGSLVKQAEEEAKRPELKKKLVLL